MKLGFLVCSAGLSLLASAAPFDPFANRALNPVTPEKAPAGGTLMLVRGGKPAFVILSDRSVEAKMDTRQLRDCRCITPAVATLKRYLEEATGATVDEDDVANAAKYPDRLQFLVGESALTRELGLRAAEMPREGFTVTTFAKGVAIVGHDSTLIPGFFREPLRLWKQGDRFGTLWGVYDFLERFLGCRFYYPGPDGRIVPPCRDLAIAPVRYSDKPYIANRGGFYMRYWPEPKRSRTLGFKATDAELADFRHSIRWTEGVVRAGTAHSPRPEAWIKANPELVDEFFFRDPSGHLWASTNSHAANFFDVTNLRNVENYVTTLKKFYASGGKDEQGFIAANGYYIPVGQCDTDVSLTTMAANETVKKLGLITEENLKLGRPGQFADIYGRFHYHLSKRLKEEFPDKQMTLIGYNSYTWPPTQAKYRPLAAPAYVALAFRKMPKFYRHDATREECVKLLKAWREWNCGVPVEMLWNYNTGNTCFVHAIANNFIGEMIRGFGGDLGTSCVFPEFQMVGNVLENKYVTQLFYFYCYYTGMRQLWNPDYDYHAGYDELWDLMFGEEAGAHLKALYAVLEDAFMTYALPTANEKALYPKDVLAKIGTELDAAEAAIRGNAVRERRFRFVQLPLRHELAIQRFRHDFRPPESAVRRDAPTVVPFMDPNGTGKPIEFSPKLSFTWTDEGLKGTLETDFEPVVGKDMWQGDVVELFFSPGEEKAWKCQLCVDAKGRMTQRQQTMKPIPGAVDCEWRMPGFTHTETRTAKGWKLEFLVPFRSLNDAAAPKPGERMSFACVYNKSLGKGGGHAMVATSVLLMDNHNADNWGWLRFEDPSAAEAVDPAAYGFSPEATPEVNAAALQKALDGGGRTVKVAKAGAYLLDRTVFIDDDTVLEFAKGTMLRKAKDYSNVLVNRGAYCNRTNRNITVLNLGISVDGKQAVPGNDSPAKGLRGQLAFYNVTNVTVGGFRCFDCAANQYCVQFVNFDGLVMEDFEIRGKKDGVHLNAGRNFIIRRGVLETGDDGIALNAGEWPGGCTPMMGSITDGLVEDVTDDPGGSCNFARVITGAWIDWHPGMRLQNRDIVRCGRNVYGVYPMPIATNEFVSLTAPTHVKGVWKSPEGINFLYLQSDGETRADIRRVTFRNIRMNCRRSISCSWELGEWARLIHPELPRKDYPVIDIRLENVVKTAPGPLVFGNADANIEMKDCRAEKGDLVRMDWSRTRTHCPVRRITVDGVTRRFDDGTATVARPFTVE